MIVNLINQHADRFLQLGLHSLWQGTAIAIFTALVCRFFITTPRQRAGLYFGSLTLLVLCVPLTLMSLSEPTSAQTLTSIVSPTPLESLPASNTSTSNQHELSQVEQSPLPLSFWIVGIYLIGLLSMMARVAFGYHWSNKIRKDGRAVSQDTWNDALTQAVAAMKLSTKPAMIWSKKVTSPIVTGILRPMIVLPVSLINGLPKEQVTAVLSHELAHLRRFDHLIVVFQRLLEALFFFHPAVWFLSRRLDQEREKACDDLVVNAGCNRADYAEVLVKIAADHHSDLTLAAAGNHDLKARIFRILNHPQPTTVRAGSGGWLTIAALIGSLGFLSLSPALSDEKKSVEVEKLEVVNAGKEAILKKLEMRIPNISFQNATLVEVVEFLRMRSIELDPTPNQSEKGINWVVRRGPYDKNDVRINKLVGQNLTFKEVLEAVCLKTKARYKVSNFAVTVLPQLAPGEEDTWIDQRKWSTLQDFPSLIAATGISHRSKSIVGHLEALGVNFPKGASASYLSSSNSLIVSNTPKNLELIDKIVKDSSQPKTAKALRDRATSSEAERLASQAHDKLLVQRRWTTPPDFLDRISAKNGVRPVSAEDCLKEYGISFLSNSEADYINESSTLIVRNTPENLKLVDNLVKKSADPDFVKNRLEAAAAVKKNAQELQQIIFPEVKFVNTTLAEALDFVRIRASELDPTKKGVDFKIADDNDLPQAKIKSLHLTNVPLPIVLQYLCDVAKTKYTVKGREISILPR